MSNTKKLVFAGLCLALCLVLPFLTGQIPQVGSMLLPMHLPVLLCGFICGWPMGLLVGFIAPLLRSFVFGMPPLFPTAVAMAFEMAAYGALCGLLYALLPKKPAFVYVSLLGAMLGGRIVWGITTALLLGGGQFTFAAFLGGALLNAWPGILLQLVLVPPLVLVLQKSGLSPGK